MKFGAVFMTLLLVGGMNAAIRPRIGGQLRQLPARVALNERLSAVNGGLLFVLLIGIAATVLLIQVLLPAHFLVGIALVPPLVLKLGTTGYRFMKYYLSDADFRIAGAPPAFMRFVVAPSLVVSTFVVMGTGLELWAFGDHFGTWWVNAHTASAVVFMVAAFLHLLNHSRRSATALAAEMVVRPTAGTITPRSVLLGCGVLALLLALASLTYATPFEPGGGG